MRHGAASTVPASDAVALAWTAGACIAMLWLPFWAFAGYLLILTLVGCDRHPAAPAVAILCVVALVVLGPLVALKLPVPALGNDKPQYLGFMTDMRAFGVDVFLAKQPELLSFASLHAAAALFGINDLAFLALFDFYFGMLLVSVWRTDYRALPLFLLLFLSASSFFGTYANLIRQAMALPFIFLTISARGRIEAACHAALAGLAHLPALAVAAPYVMLRCAGRRTAPVGMAAGVLAMGASGRDWSALVSSDQADSYLSGKVGLYTSWENGSTFNVTLFACMLYALCRALWQGNRPRHATADRRAIDVTQRYLLALTVAAVALVVTRHMTKVYERVYIYFFVIALMTLSLIVSQIRRGPFKAFVLCGALGYGAYGFAKNLDNQPFLFRGDVYAYLTSSLFDLYHDYLMEFE
ncbi:EpsG family protein [Burkholderia ambifaria]|uniref:EpsG family protein n=1 Tax=Burkholderia ambifaria TaxID=152480 RepID=UPI0015899FDF|nr:EpsG family protein [Burkholderia ambifaria]UEP50893.1 EpsG family protein [Burkholderia ambifaria]